MNIKRFFGKNSKEALNLVKKALGDNAVILSNRSVNGGNEIMAFKEEEINALIHEEMENDHDFAQHDDFNPERFMANHAQAQSRLAAFNAPSAQDTMRPDMHRASTRQQAPAAPTRKIPTQQEQFSAQYNQQPTAPVITKPVFERIERPAPIKPVKATAQPTTKPARTSAPQSQEQAQMAAMLKEMSAMRREIELQLSAFKPTELKPINQLPSQKAPKPTKPQPEAVQHVAPPTKPENNPQIKAMLDEMRNMRSAFESKLTSLNWANIGQQAPLKSQVLSMMLAAGFSPSLARQLAEKLPTSINGKQTNPELATLWIKSVLALNLDTIEHEQELFDHGGVFALVGPTGVGKTTTTAKLAARYVMKHGTEHLGIITTDAYRVGGHEQLRIYGKILGVMVHAVKDETDLKIALNELKNKHTILIDTVGVSQRDRMVAEQMAMLSSTQRPINKLLCLSATATGATLSDVVRAYKGKGLAGCILTKVDEAATIGNALDVIIRNKLKMYYATNGQRVPEDIVLSNKKALIQQAFTTDASTQLPYEFLDEEIPFLMGHLAKNNTAKQSGEIDYV